MVFMVGLIWWITDASVGTPGHPLCSSPLPPNTRPHSSCRRHGGAEQVTISCSKQSPCLNLPPVAHLHLPLPPSSHAQPRRREAALVPRSAHGDPCILGYPCQEAQACIRRGDRVPHPGLSLSPCPSKRERHPVREEHGHSYRGRGAFRGQRPQSGRGLPRKPSGQLTVTQMPGEPRARPGMGPRGRGAILGHPKPHCPEPQGPGEGPCLPTTAEVVSFGFELHRRFPNCVPENTRVSRSAQVHGQISSESLPVQPPWRDPPVQGTIKALTSPAGEEPV